MPPLFLRLPSIFPAIKYGRRRQTRVPAALCGELRRPSITLSRGTSAGKELGRGPPPVEPPRSDRSARPRTRRPGKRWPDLFSSPREKDFGKFRKSGNPRDALSSNHSRVFRIASSRSRFHGRPGGPGTTAQTSGSARITCRARGTGTASPGRRRDGPAPIKRTRKLP